MAMPEVGAPAPAFTLPDQNGRSVSLADFAGRWVVLYFYPKDDTPGCTKEAMARHRTGSLRRSTACRSRSFPMRTTG